MIRVVFVADRGRVWLVPVGNSDPFFLRHPNKPAPKKVASDDLPADTMILPQLVLCCLVYLVIQMRHPGFRRPLAIPNPSKWLYWSPSPSFVRSANGLGAIF
jgi:hypothetical protein